MHHVKWIFNAINYGFYCFYSFTLIDVLKKLLFKEFYLTNATNFTQLILTIISAFFLYAKYKAYKRDSETKSEILKEELIAKRQANKSTNTFYKGFQNEFITPFKDKKNETIR